MTTQEPEERVQYGSGSGSEASMLLGIGDEVWVGAAFSLVVLMFTYYFFVERKRNRELENRRRAGAAAGADGGGDRHTFQEDSTTTTGTSHHQSGSSSAATAAEGFGRVRSSPQDCPVCLEEVKYAVETNCGHVYCGSCIFSVVDLSDRGLLETPSCPYCRQKMTIMLPFFSEAENLESSSVDISARTEVLDNIRQYNRYYSGQPRSITEHLWDAPMLTRRMMRYLSTYDGLTFVMNFRIVPYLVMTVVYAISPFDILPEGLLGVVGILDDVVVLIMCVLYVVTIYRNFAAENLN